MLDPRTDDFDASRFFIQNLQDEIRVEELCRRFLEIFYCSLVEEKGIAAEEASSLAYGADYFLREFIIPDCQENIFEVAPERVRQFAGNWYIIKTLEPNRAELQSILAGVDLFYRWCAELGKIDREAAQGIHTHCDNIDYYEQRIEDFWAITGDGYFTWDRQCPLK